MTLAQPHKVSASLRLGDRALEDSTLLTPGSAPTVGCSCQGTPHPSGYRKDTHNLQSSGGSLFLLPEEGGRREPPHPGLCTTLSSLQLGHPGHGEDPTLQPCPKPSALLGPLEP